MKLNRLSNAPIFPEYFDEWVREPRPRLGEDRLLLPEFDHLSTKDDLEEVLTETENAFTREFNNRQLCWPLVVLGSSSLQRSHFTLKVREGFPAIPSSERKCDAWEFKVQGGLEHFTLTGAVIHEFYIQTTSDYLQIANRCIIGRLIIMASTPVELELNDCIIGTLEIIDKAELRRFEINRSAIATIQCPLPLENNPFKGPVRFSETNLATSRSQTGLFQGPQVYRNLLAHLEALNNTVAANQIRAKQIEAEREDDRGIAWGINWMYGTFANYGTSPGRPLIWFLVFYAIVALAAYWGDATTLSLSNGYGTGQYTVLSDPEAGRLSRALLIPFQSTVNPLGVLFDGRKALIPVSIWWGVGLTLYGLFSDILILMFAFCIRRRFKVH